MKVTYLNWQIKSYTHGGYVVQKKIGKQWKEPAYFLRLSQAAQYLQEQSVYRKSTDININPTNNVELRLVLDKLVATIEDSRDQIVEVLHD